MVIVSGDGPLNGAAVKTDQVPKSKRLEKQKGVDRELAMARSKDGLRRCSAVLEYMKSFNEVERKAHERFKKRTRKQTDNERGQGNLAREEISGKFRQDIL